MFLAYWVHNLSPFVVQFTDTIGIRYYGLAYLLGFVGGGLLLNAYARAGRSRLPSALVPDFIIALVIGVMVGGRLGSFLLYEGWRSLGTDPLAIFKIWQGIKVHLISCVLPFIRTVESNDCIKICLHQYNSLIVILALFPKHYFA